MSTTENPFPAEDAALNSVSSCSEQLATFRCRIKRAQRKPHRVHVVGVMAVLILAIHSGLLAWSAMCHSPTLNEPAHLVAGLSHWESGQFELYRVNPPLTRLIAAVPVLLAGYEGQWTAYRQGTGARPVFDLGASFVDVNGERSVWLFTIARWACIPISVIGAVFCGLWSRELWRSNVAGLLSLTLWCFDPTIAAHGALITPDCAAASFGVGAGYFCWRWLRRPGWNRVFPAGVLLGLAAFSKTTWIILFLLWPLLWVSWTLLRFRTHDSAAEPQTLRNRSRQGGQLGTILLIGLSVVNFGYGCDGTMTPLGQYTFVSRALTGADTKDVSGNRFENSILKELPLPLPRQYVLGVDVQKRDFEEFDRPSYLRGEWRYGGWWYYYLYAFAVKLPHGTQFLLLLATWVWINRKSDVTHLSWRDLLSLLSVPAVIVALVSAQLEFNHHFRYVLPAYGYLFVLAGINVAHLKAAAFQVNRTPAVKRDVLKTPSPSLTGTTRVRSIPPTPHTPKAGHPRDVLVLVLATFLSFSFSYPHQISYFNEFSGGGRNGHQHLLGSSLDWGQDLLYVKQWITDYSIDPHDYRILSSAFKYNPRTLIGEPPRVVGEHRFEIISARKLVDPKFPRAESLASRLAEPIGGAMWVVPAEKTPVHGR